jgi:hypothetical protein
MPEKKYSRINTEITESAIILEYAYKAYSKEINSFDKLDTKAAALVGLIGIIITLAAGASKYLFLSKDSIPLELIDFIIWFLIRSSYLIFLTILVFALLRFINTLKIRSIRTTASIKKVVEHFRGLQNNDLRGLQLIKLLINNIAKVEKELRRSNRLKADDMAIGVNYLLISVYIAIAGFLFHIISFMLILKGG